MAREAVARGGAPVRAHGGRCSADRRPGCMGLNCTVATYMDARASKAGGQQDLALAYLAGVLDGLTKANEAGNEGGAASARRRRRSAPAAPAAGPRRQLHQLQHAGAALFAASAKEVSLGSITLIVLTNLYPCTTKGDARARPYSAARTRRAGGAERRGRADGRSAHRGQGGAFRQRRPGLVTEAELDRLIPYGVVQSHRAGEVIFQKGDPGESLMVVLKGRVKIGSISVDGRNRSSPSSSRAPASGR